MTSCNSRTAYFIMHTCSKKKLNNNEFSQSHVSLRLSASNVEKRKHLVPSIEKPDELSATDYPDNSLTRIC